MGVTLFNLLLDTNDIVELPLNNAEHTYADDAPFLFHGHIWESVHTCRKDMAIVGKAISNNLLTMNVGKTEL